MKKLPTFLFFIIFLFFVLKIIYPLPSEAQGCGGILGSNVAANWYQANLELIRNSAGCSGPIPIEVIITPAERDNPQLLLDLQNMLNKYNFVPTWRPWGNGMPQGGELQAWIDATSVLTIGQFQLFNEPNNCYFGCFSGAAPNPTADAAAALAFLEASQRGEITVPLALMPLSPRTPDGGNFLSEQNYWTQFNNACGGCVSDFDYIGLNIYPQTSPGANPNQNVNNFINDYLAQANFFASLGVNISATTFLVGEAGLDPSAYIGNFSQRVADTIAFAQALEARIASNPSIFINIDQITFFLMDESTGKQFLVYRQCDAAGNCQWVIEGYVAYNPNVPGWVYQLLCNPNNPGDQDSRPVPCDACNRTDFFTGSCATAFTVNDEVTYRRGDVDFWCPDENGEPWLERDWGGRVIIDPSDTTIPFVGKKEQEDEQKYLADYFEGTDKYYANYPDPVEAMNHLGVFRKIAPQTVQDDLKKEMVYRAIMTKAGRIREGGIHDYLVTNGTYSHKLSEFPGHFPPEIDSYATSEEWMEAYQSWKETEWGQLWPYVPMFSREDTPGWILPYLGARPLDQFAILNPEAQIEKVPHLARLYEVSQAINEIILPSIQEVTQPQGKIKTFLASAKDNVLGEKIYLARARRYSMAITPEITPLGGNSYSACWTFEAQADCGLYDLSGNLSVSLNGGVVYSSFWGTVPRAFPYHCTYAPFPGPIPVTANPGDTITICANVTNLNHTCGEDPRPSLSNCVSCTINSDGSTSCGGAAPPPGPACGLSEPWPVSPCERPAITDPNPNDDLCCSPIRIALSATDQFENTDYIPCGVKVSCNPDTGICRDACEQTESRFVNRQIGINLLHPYLSEIWDYAAAPEDGVFNIFRPETVPEFEPLDAASSIFYSYDSGGISPPGGEFYFPYLGGIQKAKEWVITTLNPHGKGGRPPGQAAPASPTTLGYTIDFRNQNITISEAAKDLAIIIVLNSWPDSKIESHWNYVYNQAVSHDWNPAFVIALWIEESGASGVNAHDLGCLGASRNNLSKQLDCLFSRPYANKPFEEFMCMYSEGKNAPCVFKINPHFPGNLKNWYNRLIQ